MLEFTDPNRKKHKTTAFEFDHVFEEDASQPDVSCRQRRRRQGRAPAQRARPAPHRPPGSPVVAPPVPRPLSLAQVFQCTALPMTVNLLQGMSSLLFMFGNTGSGKTYTMQVGTAVAVRRRAALRCDSRCLSAPPFPRWALGLFPP